MASFGVEGNINFTVDKNNLYREEGITDLRVASIRKLVPIKPDGSPDDTRKPVFMAHTQLMSESGPLPLQCNLKSDNLEDAMAEFPEAMEQALKELVGELNKMHQQEESRIITPDADSKLML